MIKAFLFDYGGVVAAGGAGDEISQRLAANLGVTHEKGNTLLGLVWADFVMGKISDDELWKRLEKELGKTIPQGSRNIWNSWKEHMQPKPEMLELIERLKRDGYKVGLLSNVTPTTEADIHQHGGYDSFDFTVLSCVVGYAKPDVEIYEIALGKLPAVEPNEVVFVDDQEWALVPARKLGIHTVLAKDPQQITDEIDRLIELAKN